MTSRHIFLKHNVNNVNLRNVTIMSTSTINAQSLTRVSVLVYRRILLYVLEFGNFNWVFLQTSCHKAQASNISLSMAVMTLSEAHQEFVPAAVSTQGFESSVQVLCKAAAAAVKDRPPPTPAELCRRTFLSHFYLLLVRAPDHTAASCDDGS